MRLVIQRVKQAFVEVDHQPVGKIGKGMLVLLGVGKEDNREKTSALVERLSELRIFEDADGKMNLSAREVNGAFLIVSQFTLYGDCMKGRRPSFDRAAPPKEAEELYHFFVEALKKKNFTVETGQFRAMMDVHLTNDGPVTFILEN
jgi:D-tyrosyl-tRNA(Tyr) deacylase